MGNEAEHPALSNMNTTVETVKETAKGAIGGAAKWGLISAGVVGGLAMLAPAALMLIPGVGWLAGGALALGGSTAMGASGLALGAATSAGIFGAKVGAVVGGASGLMGAGEAIEKKKQNMIDNYERNEMRQERKEAMEMRRMAMRQQMGGMGVAPDGLPRGRDMGGRQMA